MNIEVKTLQRWLLGTSFAIEAVGFAVWNPWILFAGGVPALVAVVNLKFKGEPEMMQTIIHETEAYVVESIDDDGGIEQTIFSGPNARRRAQRCFDLYDENGDTASLQPYKPPEQTANETAKTISEKCQDGFSDRS